MTRWRHAVVATMGATALALGFPLVPTAHADDAPILQPQMDALCRAQYPGTNAFHDGSAYLTAPGDAYSWRCQQVSKSPGGGAISNLGIDPAAYCSIAPNRGAPTLLKPGSSDGWVCRTP